MVPNKSKYFELTLQFSLCLKYWNWKIVNYLDHLGSVFDHSRDWKCAELSTSLFWMNSFLLNWVGFGTIAINPSLNCINSLLLNGIVFTQLQLTLFKLDKWHRADYILLVPILGQKSIKPIHYKMLFLREDKIDLFYIFSNIALPPNKITKAMHWK